MQSIARDEKQAIKVDHPVMNRGIPIGVDGDPIPGNIQIDDRAGISDDHLPVRFDLDALDPRSRHEQWPLLADAHRPLC